MTGEGEAVGDVLTGAVVASTVERETVEREAGTAGTSDPGEARAACRNCGAQIRGAFCAACGQPAHLHRSLLSLGHDILHSVFHFEGKFWRTVPLLMLHPGRLTRRYIDGERAKFISPMALFLFAVFLMFAVFSFIGGSAREVASDTPLVSNFQSGNRSALETTQQRIADFRDQLADPALAPEQRAEIEQRIADLEASRVVMEALASGDWRDISDVQKRANAQQGAAAQEAAPEPSRSTLERRMTRKLKQLSDNPGLLAYKLKTNGYKFSWALVPMSIPFMWLLFFWRRDIRLYDHAVFVTYSISFMMLLAILASLLSAMGVGTGFLVALLLLAPPIHVYRQLRGAYGLSRAGALVRLFFLFIVVTIVLSFFMVMLLLIGMLD